MRSPNFPELIRALNPQKRHELYPADGAHWVGRAPQAGYYIRPNMPVIAHIGSVVTVIPSDEIQVVSGPGKHEFIADRSPFAMKVSGFIEEKGKVIGVYGDVVSGHERYRGLIATLLTRLDNSDWTRDNHSAAGFKVGRNPARPNGKHAVSHLDGTDIDGFPYILRFGSIDSRIGSEPLVNSANEAFQESQHTFIRSHANDLQRSPTGIKKRVIRIKQFRRSPKPGSVSQVCSHIRAILTHPTKES